MGTPAIDPGAEAREAVARADQAEAEARSARVAAQKAASEQAEWDSEIARQQCAAEARQKLAEAEQAARKAAAAVDPVLERQKQEAEAKQAVADADRATTEAQQAQIAALIPDLSKVDRGETKVSGDQAVYSSVLAHRALDTAVTHVVADLRGEVENRVVLITDDPDLATSDAAYIEVTKGLTLLTDAATKLLEDTGDAPIEGADAGATLTAAALAAVVPPLISLFSAHRTVSSFSSTVDTTAAIAVVAGALTQHCSGVRLDDFRLVPDATVYQTEAGLRERRARLVTRKVELDRVRADAETTRASEQGRADALTMQLDKPAADVSPEDRARWERDREIARRSRDLAAKALTESVVKVTVVDALMTAIDAFLVSLHAVPPGGKRAPIVLAALREQLHGADPVLPRVLFIKASAGSADQLFTDKPLWFDDDFHTVASVSLSYWLLDTRTSNVLRAGVGKGSVQLKIDIGNSFSFDQP